MLDEADEMLRMGFVDDVEAHPEEDAADEQQIALFSATMPPPIRRIAQTHLREPREITIKSRERRTAATSASATGWSAACTSSMR